MSRSVVLLLAAACTAPRLTEDEALRLVWEHIESHPDLPRPRTPRPFHVGTWADYQQRCADEGPPFVRGLESHTEGKAVVVYRTPFLPQGGGSESIFIVDPRTRAVLHVAGLSGR